ncbi:hypothetical protein CHLRE_05g242600v5 [Chlamydomonas reinhardtii]|uniref:GATA-type domain-containing protein n=1 Tax=Chlamydomonas reinhardtii TaxID=3055 RepID=A0A2K3DSF0_CHLRE|nr:uncharacterized protein CHLRE_05g242600v5 [Chlamydomonas reinhardtii]PNW83459.1 hypothetical protein CHLRE_05g242600v5 [Chlamydomonas reinhardtii]
MAPAPAFEPSCSMLSVFSMCTALPLAERDVNGAGACFSGASALACPSKPASIRRGASFLDVEDACVGLTSADRACFLIPEDSVYVSPACSARENAGAGPRLPLPSGTFTTAVATSTSGASLSGLSAAPTGFLAGCEEFVHASVCFEKAAQALEAVTRPPPAVPSCSPSTSSGAANGAQADEPAAGLFRRVSSLAPSPAASSHENHQHQHQDGSCCSSAEAVEAPAAPVVSDGAAACAEQLPQQVLLPQVPLEHHRHEYLDASSAALQLQAQLPTMLEEQQQQSPEEAAQPEQLQLLQAVPAPAPAPRAFHHKTGGPCDHCGATESPQWRRGPPAKPMLCNACGTRYRRTNQLGPVGAHTPAGRAAAAAAAAGASVSGGKRISKGHGGAAAKRNRASY